MWATLFDHLTAPPAPVRPRRRRPPESDYKWVRPVKAFAYQARPWLGVLAGGSLNLGLFTVADHPDDPGTSRGEAAEWAAARASREFFRFYRPHEKGHGLKETLEHLKRKRYIPEDVLPPRVRLTADGYQGFVRKGGRVLATPVFADPWEAYAEMCALLAREFPPRPKKSEVRRAAQDRRRGRSLELVTLADYADYFSAA